MTDIPAGAKVPDDHKPAQQAEAEKAETAILHWGDLDFTVTADPMDLPGDFLKYAADGDAYRIVHTVLDDKQFKAFRKTKPTVGDFTKLGEQMSELYGFDDLGE